MREMVLVVVLAIILAACGGSEGRQAAGDTSTTSTTAPSTTAITPQTTTIRPADDGLGTTTSTSRQPTTTRQATTTIPSTTTASVTTTTEATSPLQRRDTPPEGTLAQFEWFEDGNGPCESFPDTAEPAIGFHLYPDPLVPSDEHTESTAVPVGRLMYICPQGFVDGVSTIDIVRPDGTNDTRRSDSVDASLDGGVPETVWRSLPGDPLGDHRVVAEGGGGVGESTFTVEQARAPGIVSDQSAQSSLFGFFGPPGTTFTFALFGFQAGQTVPLFVYVDESSGAHRYLTELPSVQVDSDGTAYFDLVTQAGDPPGSYCVQFDPTLPICQGRFWVSGP